MTPPRSTGPSRLRVATGLILGVGLGSALLIFIFVPEETALRPEWDVTQTKHYRHDLELYGGKAGVQLDELRRWFGTLWHGKALAGTVLVLSVASVLAIRFVDRFRAAGEDLKESESNSVRP
jgi:hypothetical protein